VPSFYGYDGHGNVRFLANSAGTVTDSYTFDAFGAQIASTGTTPNPYLYSGERLDSSLNLYHLRARYYNILTGRFETMDPAWGNLFYPGSLQKYSYSRNNPVNRIDPTGKADVEEYSLLTKITVAATVGLLLGVEFRELFECTVEAAESFGGSSGQSPEFPIVQSTPPPSVGPLPGECSLKNHDEWPGAPEGNPLGAPQFPEGPDAQ
jgi:RHS repeat-associated protein